MKMKEKWAKTEIDNLHILIRFFNLSATDHFYIDLVSLSYALYTILLRYKRLAILQ